MLELAIDGLVDVVPGELTIDLADARVLRGVLAGLPVEGSALQEMVGALSSKDASAVEALSAGLPHETRQALQALLRLYGGADVLTAARSQLPARPAIVHAIDELQWLASHLSSTYPSLKIGFDLGDMSGYAYYSGPRFAMYGAASSDALARGGRYDEVGAVFGRNRPAVGFSLDLKALSECTSAGPACTAIRAPWSEDPLLRAAVRRLRDAGETVIYALPGQAHAGESHPFDRELAQVVGHWLVRSI